MKISPLIFEMRPITTSERHLMVSMHRLVVITFVAFSVILTTCKSGSAADPDYDRSTWREYRAAKRQQVGDICDTWFAEWRPQTVGRTYKDLADRYAAMDKAMDRSPCSAPLRKHISRAERLTSEIGELLGQGTLPDIEAILVTAKGGAGVKTSSSISSQRGQQVLALMTELRKSEEAVIKELKLDE